MDEPDYEDYLHGLGWLEHKPRPGYPRKDHIGEHIYSQEWEKLMRTMPRDGIHEPNGMLAGVLYQHPTRITQRHALICATVVCWLGTNCGQSLLHEARRLKQARSLPQAYHMAWAAENHRTGGVNGGFRMIEHLLAPADHFGTDWLNPINTHALIRAPILTVDDYETVEHLMRWLGGDEGQAFIHVCDKEIQEHHRIARRAAQIGALPLSAGDRNG